MCSSDLALAPGSGDVQELPQLLFMRVAMGLALFEPNRNTRAIEFYTCLSQLDLFLPLQVLRRAGDRKSVV